MPAALVIGASRGIGREFVLQYLTAGWRVIATARREDDLVNLAELGAEPIELDVLSINDWAALGWKLDGEKLDLALHGAGVYGPRSTGLVAPTEAEFDQVMRINVLGAMRMVQTVGPMVVAAQGRLAVLSSRMGAKAGRSSTTGWLYRASKAALNSVLVDAALALGPQGAVCVALHPGWVKTDLGGAGAVLTAEQSVAGMRGVIAALGPSDNGRFIDQDGVEIPW